MLKIRPASSVDLSPLARDLQGPRRSLKEACSDPDADRALLLFQSITPHCRIAALLFPLFAQIPDFPSGFSHVSRI
jgi:hypothetical protein